MAKLGATMLCGLGTMFILILLSGVTTFVLYIMAYMSTRRVTAELSISTCMI